MEGGKFINPDPISGTCPSGNDLRVHCNALGEFSPVCSSLIVKGLPLIYISSLFLVLS